MSEDLTAGQRALLEAALVRRQHELDRRVAEHRHGQSRADHANEVLGQDGDDAPQREGERELDLAMDDRDVAELGVVSAALRRLAEGRYGRCADCGAGIPFDRLKVEPEALRCVACEGRRERTAA